MGTALANINNVILRAFQDDQSQDIRHVSTASTLSARTGIPITKSLVNECTSSFFASTLL